MFEKVSRSLKYDSNIFSVHKHNIYNIYYMDTTTNHFTPLALRVRGNKESLMVYHRGGSGIQKMVRPGSGCGHPVMRVTSC